MEKPKRIQLIDALRGLAVLLMVVHHFLYDLTAFCGAPWWLFSNPVFDVLHYIFAGLFILLSGVSSNFSRSNVKRGLKALACALAITAVTVWMDMPILFGVLHLLGACMVLYGLTRKLWERLPAWVAPALSLAGIVLTGRLANGVESASHYLWMLGWTYDGLVSTEYFPLLPWAFVFLLGAWLGKYIKAGKFPAWFYRADCPPLAAVGRHSLMIYVLHQPVLYALTMALLWLMGR